MALRALTNYYSSSHKFRATVARGGPVSLTSGQSFVRRVPYLTTASTRMLERKRLRVVAIYRFGVWTLARRCGIRSARVAKIARPSIAALPFWVKRCSADRKSRSVGESVAVVARSRHCYSDLILLW